MSNVQQSAAIYVRHVLAVKQDALINLIHDDFQQVHNVPLADADHETIRHAIRIVQAEIHEYVTGEQIRHATEQLVDRAWRETEGEELT